ncbi:MAG: type II secretion system F family protein [Holosporales bacterium]|jgi:type IV pilus assembly protein PilC|nr:type II secretion system F family protein [Holosporales bacterium]
MEVFRYKAVDPQGTVRSGIVEGRDAAHVAALLKQDNLAAIHVRSVSRNRFAYTNKKLLDAAVLLFFKNLTLLLNQKIPLIEALRTLNKTTTHKLIKKALQQIIFCIHAGDNFSGALSKHPHLFPDFILMCCHSAEKAGTLEEASKTIYDFLLLQNNLQKKVKKAVFYPCCVFVALAALIFIILRHMVPVAKDFLLSSGQLNFSQRLLITASDVLVGILEHRDLAVLPSGALSTTNFTIFCVFVAGFAVCVVVFLKKVMWNSFVEKRNMILWVQLFATILLSGGTVREALQISQKSSALKGKIGRVEQAILSGIPFSKALQNENMHLPSLQSFVQVGESSGQMGEMLAHSAKFEYEQLNQRIDAFFERLSPLLLLLAGLFIIWIISNTFLPLYECFSEI